MKQTQSMKSIRAALDREFRRLIHTRDGQGEYSYCCTCEGKVPTAKLEVGHWITRYVESTRWDPRNAALQCVQCNRYEDGRPERMREYIASHYGAAVPDELVQQSHTPLHLTRSKALEMLEEIKQQTKSLEGR